MKEVWKDVVGYEGLYMVSNLGEVKSNDMTVKYIDGRVRLQKGRVLKPGSNMGYPRVNLVKDGKVAPKLVHRLLAEAFLPNPENKREVNHIDGDKANCTVNNLEWTTPSQNMKHAFKTGLNSFKELRDCRKSVIMCDGKGNELKMFSSVKEALIFLGKPTKDGSIGASIKHNRKAYGYKWKWAK